MFAKGSNLPFCCTFCGERRDLRFECETCLKHLPDGEVVELADSLELPVVEVRRNKGSDTVYALENPECGEVNDALA